MPRKEAKVYTLLWNIYYLGLQPSRKEAWPMDPPGPQEMRPRGGGPPRGRGAALLAAATATPICGRHRSLSTCRR